MGIIDAHLHVSFNATELVKIAKELSIDYGEAGLLKEMSKNGVTHAVGISSPGNESPFSKQPTPVDSENILPFYKRNKNILGVCTVNPLKVDTKILKSVEKSIKEKVFKAFKIFPGYFYFYPHDKVYHHVYRLAEKHGLPVIIHSGITFKKNALMKYAHPMHVDDAATLFPNVKFIMAHLGNPWMETAKAVMYKNDNVYADLSGLFEGSGYAEKEDVKDEILKLTKWVGYDRLLYGSDWPIVRMDEYLSVLRWIIPQEFHQKVFYDNARKIFDFNL
ncbi:amidohydrolase [Candidatus Woesearchaeota archaeon]|nr:amidohydrolase [Candidatus Woesearchaeota archaeon]